MAKRKEYDKSEEINKRSRTCFIRSLCDEVINIAIEHSLGAERGGGIQGKKHCSRHVTLRNGLVRSDMTTGRSVSWTYIAPPQPTPPTSYE